MKLIKTLLFLCYSIAAVGSLQAQNALENFESYSVGNNLSTPLSGGIGWTGSWVTAGTTTASGVVANTSPLAAGANQYLDVDLTNTTAGTAMGIGRQLASGAPTGDFTVTFQWRADDLTGFGAGGTTTNDRFEFYSSSSAASVNTGGTGANVTTTPYLAGVFGAARGTNYTTGGLFAVYSPVATNDAFDVNRYFNLGSVATGGNGTTLTLTAGTVYSFTINVVSASKTWDISVSDGLTTASSTNLKWWGNNAQPLIGFGARGSVASETRSFSFDNVQVVPEPNSVALLCLGAAAILLRRNHRRWKLCSR